MFYAKFPIDGVKKIYEHSIANPVYQPTFSQMFEAKHRKDRKDFDAIGESKWPTADDVDTATLSPSFFIVKDDGAYIMAATEVRLVGDNTHNFVVYCEGCNPKIDEEFWETQQREFGGDDFGEGLPLEWLRLAIENAEKLGIDRMIIKVTANNMQLVQGRRM